MKSNFCEQMFAYIEGGCAFVRFYYINVYCSYKSEQINSCLCVLLVLLNNYIRIGVCLFIIKLSENSKNRWIFQGNKSEQIFAFVYI